MSLRQHHPHRHTGPRKHGQGLLLWAAASLSLYQASWALPAPDGQTYHCVDQQGRATYSQQPCGDQAQLKSVADTRTPGQALDARLMAERENKLGKQLAHQRRHEERAEAQSPAMTLTRPARQHAETTYHAMPANSTWSDTHTERLKRKRHFTALVPKTPKAAKANTTASSKPAGT
jgi:Domain of unknown function (DUF4124)